MKGIKLLLMLLFLSSSIYGKSVGGHITNADTADYVKNGGAGYSFFSDTLLSGMSADTVLNVSFTATMEVMFSPIDSIWDGHFALIRKTDTLIIKSSSIEPGDRPYQIHYR